MLLSAVGLASATVSLQVTLKSLSVSFSPVLRSVNWLPVCFLHSKVAPRIHFRPAAQTCPDRPGQVCLFCRQRQHWNLCRFINIHAESCFFSPLLPFLTIPFGSFIFLNIQLINVSGLKYLSNVQLEGPSRLWLKRPEAIISVAAAQQLTQAQQQMENSGRQSIKISTKYTHYV